MSELPEKQVKRLRALIQEAETNLAAAKELLISIVGEDDQVITPRSSTEEVSGKVIEGVFDGQMMLGPDGKNYPIPANYASKSQIVEGDILKLTIADDGRPTKGGSLVITHCNNPALAEELKNVSFGTPSMPVYCNYEARVVEGPDDIRNVLEHQVCGSVRWTASMQKLVDQGHRLFIELGPGKTLAGMMGRICKDATVISIEDVPSLEAAVAELNK